jgi:hypothetical protein
LGERVKAVRRLCSSQKLYSARSSFIHSFIHQWFCSPLLGPGLIFSLAAFFTQTVGLLGQEISPSQGRYLHTGRHKHRINAHTDIYVLSGIRTHDLSVRAGEDSSCLRPRGDSVIGIPLEVPPEISSSSKCLRFRKRKLFVLLVRLILICNFCRVISSSNYSFYRLTLLACCNSELIMLHIITCMSD